MPQATSSLLFITPDSFSKKGGIQQYNRVLASALFDFCREKRVRFHMMSLHDGLRPDTRYLPADLFTGYEGRKLSFLWEAMGAIDDADIVIIGHINLWPLVRLAKLAGADARFILLTHGVEVWPPLKPRRRYALQQFHTVCAVSHFTARQLQAAGVADKSITILPNTIDPLKQVSPDPVGLQQRLRIDWDGPLLLTVARVAATEKAKGFMEVMACLPALVEKFAGLRYIIAGPAEAAMASEIHRLADQLGIRGKVLLAGELTDAQLAALYERADVFTLPSTKEGFGIVYLEAALHGLPIVALNAGGAPEALLQGELGYLCEPGNGEALTRSLGKAIQEAVDGGHVGKLSRQSRASALLQPIFGIDFLKHHLHRLLAAPT